MKNKTATNLKKKVKQGKSKLIQKTVNAVNDAHRNIVGHLNAFAPEAKNVSALTNPVPTVKFAGRGKITFTASATQSVLLMLGPTGWSDSLTSGTTTNTGLPYNDGTNGESGIYAMSTSTHGNDALVCSSTNATTSIFPNFSSVAAHNFPSYVTASEGYNAEALHREVSFGVRISNRTAAINRSPIAYVFHDINHEIRSKRYREPTLKIQDVYDFITGHASTIVWDCIRDPIFEMSIVPTDTRGSTSSDFKQYPSDGYDLLGNENLCSSFAAPIFNANVPIMAGAIAWNATNSRYQVTGSGIVPNIYIMFPSSSTANTYEVSTVIHGEHRSADLERIGMLTENHSNPQVESIINQVKRSKHTHMGRTMIHAIKPAVKAAVARVAQTASDKAAMAVVTSAAALL